MAWDSGIGGKADDDYSAMLTLGPGDDGMGAGFIYTDTGWTRTKAQPGSKYLVFETNIFPTTRGDTLPFRHQWTWLHCKCERWKRL